MFITITKRRIISILLTAVMILNIIPIPAIAVSAEEKASTYNVTTILEPSIDAKRTGLWFDEWSSMMRGLQRLEYSGGYYYGDNYEYYNPKTGEHLFTDGWFADKVVGYSGDYLIRDFYEDVVIVETEDKVFIIDYDGEVRGSFDYELAEYYDGDEDWYIGISEGLLAVRVGGRYGDYGFVNMEGELVIPLEYSIVKWFNEGLAQVGKGFNWIESDNYYGGYYEYYKYGFINPKGEVVIPIEYDYVGDFGGWFYGQNSEDGKFAPVYKGQNWIERDDGEMRGYYEEAKCGFINTEGEVVVPLEYDWCEYFYNGYAKVYKDEKKGFVDTKGNVVVPIIYDEIHNFDENGIAAVAIGSWNNYKWGYVNTKGEVIVPIEYSSVWTHGFVDGLSIAIKNNKFGFINTKGEVVIPLEYGSAWTFRDGFGIVFEGSGATGKRGIFDSNGNVILPVEYDEARYFSEGLAGVGKDGKTGFINEKGETVIPFEYSYSSYNNNPFYYPGPGSWSSTIQDKVYKFSNGMTTAHKNGKWQVINTKGEYIGDSIEDLEGRYWRSESLTVIRTGLETGLFGYDGEIVIPTGTFDEFIYAGTEDDATYAWVRKNDLWGIVSIAPNTATTTKSLPNFISPIEIIADKSDWISVSNREELEAIADNLDGKYYLVNDIDLSGKNWTPIGCLNKDAGSSPSRFTGVFDGQGYEISNLTVTGGNRDMPIGLFSYADSATIKNVGLKNIDIQATAYESISIGGISGSVADSDIENCYSMGSIATYGDSYVGGIVGIAYNENTVTDCYNTADIIIEDTLMRDIFPYAGGIVGYLNLGWSGLVSRVIVNNCYNTGDITATGYNSTVGGIVSYLCNSSDVIQCYNSGNITAVSPTGILVDEVNGGASLSALPPKFARAGGISGIVAGSEIRDCYNIGSVTAVAADYAIAGGIAAIVMSNGALYKTYNSGDVSATAEWSCTVGGISGENNEEADISHSYWSIDSQQSENGVPVDEKRGQGYSNDNVGTTTPLTTVQMQQQSSFVGFDFDNVWTFIDGVNNNMPVLRAFEHMYTPTTTEPPTTTTQPVTTTTEPPTTTTQLVTTTTEPVTTTNDTSSNNTSSETSPVTTTTTGLTSGTPIVTETTVTTTTTNAASWTYPASESTAETTAAIMPPICKCEGDICNNLTLKPGHILGNEGIEIFDFIELLLYLVKLGGSTIELCENAFNAALITKESVKNGNPEIFDGIEILMYLVGLPCELNADKSIVDKDHPGNLPIVPLSEERERKILEDYAEFINENNLFHRSSEVKPYTADDLKLLRYCGSFGGYDIVSIYPKEMDMHDDVMTIEIDGYKIFDTLSSSEDIMVYTGDDFVGIAAAYNRGLLQLEDIRALTFQNIRRAYTHYIRGDNSIEDYKTVYDKVIITNYYGRGEKGYEIFSVENRHLTEKIGKIEIAGYKLNDNIIVRHHWFNELSDAFKNGYISEKDIVNLYNEYFSTA